MVNKNYHIVNKSPIIINKNCNQFLSDKVINDPIKNKKVKSKFNYHIPLITKNSSEIKKEKIKKEKRKKEEKKQWNYNKIIDNNDDDQFLSDKVINKEKRDINRFLKKLSDRSYLDNYNTIPLGNSFDNTIDPITYFKQCKDIKNSLIDKITYKKCEKKEKEILNFKENKPFFKSLMLLKKIERKRNETINENEEKLHKLTLKHYFNYCNNDNYILEFKFKNKMKKVFNPQKNRRIYKNK